MKQIGLRKLIPLPWPGTQLPSWRAELLASLRAWEVYVIVLIAALLRFYRLDTTQFDDDQAKIFHMAYDAVHQGMLVATANGASLHLLNPPATIYFLMLPAAISANPLWGTVMTSLLAMVSVWLTYVVTRRYFGRPAGTLAALFYATASYAVFYSRFMWNQNFLFLFVLLFILVLLQGTFERRKGWLAFALPLLGLLYQFHGSSSLLGTALIVALLLSPGTLRWRDLLYGVAGLLLIYLPYLLWEYYTQFRDIQVLLDSSQRGGVVDNLSFLLYQQFLVPYNDLFTRVHTPYRSFSNLLITCGTIAVVLVIMGGIVILLSSLFTRVEQEKRGNGFVRWWRALRADPARSSLLVLVVWQIGPLLLLINHSISLHQHYLIILLPGPFMVLGIFLSGLAEWLQFMFPWKKIAMGAIYALALVLITIQFGSSAAILRGFAQGQFDARDWSSNLNYYNDLHSLQAALQRADVLAQQKHIARIYVSTDNSMKRALQYLAGQQHTPTTVFDDSCLVLPNPSSGPGILLVGPYSAQVDALARHFGSATLIERLERLSGGPFRLYIVQPRVQGSIDGQATFQHDLQSRGAVPFTSGKTTLVVTRWDILRAAPASFQTSYTYAFKNLEYASKLRNFVNNDSLNSPTKASTLYCTATSLQAGDQLFAAFPSIGSAAIQIQASFFKTAPLVEQMLSMPFETGTEQTSPATMLQTGDGRITVSIAIA
jgi:4-amino-4-deoxy-L-arabinose transferase-like glycosyltransferase